MSQAIKVNPKHPQKTIINKAARIIKKGGLVAFPTETVYGIAASISNSAKLDKIKKRPRGKPYTIHIAYKKDLKKIVDKLSPTAKKTIRKYWPGPLTLLLKDRSGKKTGFRMPDNKIALALIRAIGKPIIAPSANLSGEPSPVKASQVCKGLDLIIDGGPTKHKKDSTILDLTIDPPMIIRKGCIKITK